MSAYKEQLAKSAREYYQRNKERINARHHDYRCRMKEEVLSYYSTADYPVCAYCGETDIDVLCLDHIDNKGAEWRRNRHNYYAFGVGLALWLKKEKFPEGFQILCANCNLKKHRNKLRRESKYANSSSTYG